MASAESTLALYEVVSAVVDVVSWKSCTELATVTGVPPFVVFKRGAPGTPDHS